MRRAINAGAPYSEYKCWAIVTMGKMHESQGDLDSALYYYDFAVEEREGYAFGLAGKANVYEKQGDLEKAKDFLNQAIAKIPEIGFHIDLARIMQKEGEEAALKTKIAEIEEMFTEDIESGHNMNMEYAIFLMEFKNDLNGALETAKQETYERENNIDVNKTLALINYRLGNTEKAKNQLEVALRTDKKDADLICLKGLIDSDKTLIKKSFKMNPYQGHVLVEEAKQKLN